MPSASRHVPPAVERQPPPDDSPAASVPSTVATRPIAKLRRTLALSVHLARREIAVAHRDTLLGWMWPLARQLAQLAVLVFAFSAVFDLGIDNFPVFVFSGLIAWTWFSSGISASTWSVVQGRHLVLQPAFPTAVLPLVAVTIPLLDVLVALPILVVMLISTGGLHWTVVLFPLLLAVQFCVMTGMAWILGAVSVFLRDIPSLVTVVIGTLFYLTPVFYPASRVPERYAWVMDWNPVATLLEAYRSVLLDGQPPDWGPVLYVFAVGLMLCVAGYLVFRRLAPGFAEEL